MAYNPVPIQKKYQWRAGGALFVIGVLVFIAGVILSPLNPILMVIGATLAVGGHLMQLFAE